MDSGAEPNAHATDDESLGLIAQGGWDVVVLQEQSQIPTIEVLKDAVMIPGATALDEAIGDSGACTRTVLFLTWGREDGGMQCGGGYCSPDFADFSAMQAALTEAYLEVASLLGAGVAPVGVAWEGAVAASPEVALFAGDGSHPSEAGTYLAACVMYVALLGESPVGVGSGGGDDAALLQEIAAETVLASPEQWGLPW